MVAQQDIMAQAVWLAQLEAAKGTCQCKTCQILRKAATAMTAQFLAVPGINPATALGDLPGPLPTEKAEEE